MAETELLTQYVRERSFTIAAQIAFFRKQRGHTQESLARVLNIPQSEIARLEKTPDTQWTSQTLSKIAGALDLKVSVEIIPNA